MEETIKNTFNLLKKVILENEYIKKEDPHIYNFFAKNKPLYSEFIRDENILRLSLIYKYGDLGRIHWSETEDCKKISEIHRDVSEQGRKYYGISLYELELLSEEVFEQNNIYSDLITSLEYYKKKCKEIQSIENLKNLITITINLKREDESLKYINSIKNYFEQDPSSIYDYLMLKSKLYITLVNIPFNNKIKKGILDKLDLEELIEIFEEKEDENKLLGIYDHAIFLEMWITILKIYFQKKSVDGIYFTNKKINTKNDIKNYIYERFQISNDDDFKKILYLTKKHDSLLLELIKIYSEPCLPLFHFFSFTPIYNGTFLLIFRTLMNLNFPKKYDYLLNNLDRFYRNNYSFENFNLSSLKKRLLTEFPKKRSQIQIKIASIEYSYCLSDKAKTKENICNLESIAEICEALLNIKYTKAGYNRDDIWLFGDSINLLIKYHISLGEIKKAKRIATDLINGENIKILENYLRDIILAFYKAKKYPEFIELTNRVIVLQKNKKINIEISEYFGMLAEAYLSLGEKEKIDVILKYYENENFDINLQNTLCMEEYEDIKKMRNSI